jgi:hypothetical protein
MGHTQCNWVQLVLLKIAGATHMVSAHLRSWMPLAPTVEHAARIQIAVNPTEGGLPRDVAICKGPALQRRILSGARCCWHR